ncbi:hypothetical protein ECZU27_20070 [Escherichia coli]|nr:hypothetical protein ECZU27_20070 [Escherichia coli]
MSLTLTLTGTGGAGVPAWGCGVRPAPERGARRSIAANRAAA